jgi:glycine/D-amino acid oxidase-like deaminating enzyme
MGEVQRFLIIGQGLAGTALAWRLWERGVAFVIVDRDEAVTCSKIAAGLVTPITGMRLNLNWRFVEQRDEAVALYRAVEGWVGRQVYFPLDQVRLFRDEAARALFRRRMEDPALARQVVRVDWAEGSDAGLLNAEQFRVKHGGFEQTGGGYLDTERYLQASRKFFEARGAWKVGEVTVESLTAGPSEVTWCGETFSAAVFCQGWEAAGHPWFDWVPFQSARGSIITAHAPSLEGEQRVVNSSGCWLLPRGEGVYKLGPTYEPQFDRRYPHQPDESKLSALRERVENLVVGPVAWQEVKTAVRPIVKRAKLLIGRHPKQELERVGFFNGLGSKGALRAPWAARHLMEHWLDGKSLELEVDLRHNLPS